MGDRDNLPELPKGWVWSSAMQICELITNGNTPKQVDMAIGKGEIPYIKIHNLTKTGNLDFSINPTFIPKEVHENKLPKSKIYPGDVLMNVVGPPLGKVSIVPPLYAEWNTNQNICIFRTVDLFNKKYLTYCLLSDENLNSVSRKSTATAGQSFISLTNCRSLPIPVPPIPEQHRIVAKIEELFTQLDAGVELLKKLKAKLKRYRQAVLKAAVEGKLTKDWREAHQGELEPASVLLERILKERREKWEAEQLAQMKAKGKTPKDDSWKLKYKEQVAPDTSDLPELPEGWVWATFDQTSERVTVGHVGSMKDEYIENGIPFLRSQNVRENRFDSEGLKFISQEFHENLKKSSLQPGDLVVVRSGSVGVSCVIPETLKEANCSDLVIVKQPRAINPHYGAFYMNSIARSRVNAQQVGVALIHFNTKSMAMMPVPVPPSREQMVIVEEVERCISVVNKLETVINQNLKRSEKLRQSILKKAFEGKLVPQDPADEPADKLLERIKAEKAKREAEAKAKKKQKQPGKSQQLELF
jgi:type I restriction enzyme S subunit